MQTTLQSQHCAQLVHALVERLHPDASMRQCSEYAKTLLDFSTATKEEEENAAELQLFKDFGDDAHNLYTILADKDEAIARSIIQLLMRLKSTTTTGSLMIRTLPSSNNNLQLADHHTSASSSYRGVKDFLLALHGSEQNEILLVKRWGAEKSESEEWKFISRAVEIGSVHRKIRRYSDGLINNARSLVSIRFAHAIQDELCGGDQFLVLLEQQHKAHLAQLYAWSLAFHRRLQLLWQICESARGLCGGNLVSALFALRACHGYSEPNQTLISRLLNKSFSPLYNMLTRYCTEGKFVDDYREFFITGNDEVNPRMKPSFVSQELAQRVCRLGKSARVANQLHVPRNAATTDSTSDVVTGLEAYVTCMEVETNTAIKHALFTKHHLLDHLCALKDFLLLARGDFSQLLVENLAWDCVNKMEWQNQVEYAIQNSNASTLTQAVLSCVTINQESDYFCLDYVVDFPLNLIVTSLDKYFAGFQFLWKLKRTQYTLDAMWKLNITQCRGKPHNSSVVHKCSLVRAEMIHLVSNLHSYVMTEVVDASWDQLVADLTEAKSLHELEQCHDQFLNNVLLRGLIDDDGEVYVTAEEEGAAEFVGARMSKSPIFALRSKVHLKDTLGLPKQLNSLLDYILNFCSVQEKLFARLRECDEDSEEEERAAMEFFKPVDAISSKFWESLHVFLRSLQACSSESLRFLGIKLNFNRIY